MGDKERDGSEPLSSWNRRRVLTATTIGITGLAGCGGSGDSGEEEEEDDDTTDLNGSSSDDDANDMGGSSDDGNDDGSGGGSGSEDIPVTECPMIPGSYTTFDPDNGPIPYSFEYPEAVASIEYGEQRRTIVSGTFERTEDTAQEGDIFMSAAVNTGPEWNENSKQNWYDQRSDRETFLTTTISGSDVEFLSQVPGGVSSEDQTSHSVIGLAPYNWDNSEDSYLTGIKYYEVSMGIRLSLGDDKTIASSCVDNLLASLERSVESIEMQDNMTLFEERV